MQSIGSAAGFCNKHQMDKMFVGTADATEPTCLRCDAESRPKMGRTVIAEDPGEGFFKGKGSDAKITVLETTHGENTDLNQPYEKVAGPVVPTIKANSLENHIHHALSWLTTAPMPKDIKQFKSLQKSITILESLLEKANG